MKQKVYNIIGAAMTVHNILGPGFNEKVYQESLAIEFDERKIPFYRERPIEIYYKGKKLNSVFKADFLCYDSIIVELKAVSNLDSFHYAQIMNYLKASNLPKGILLNFGEAELGFQSLGFL